MAIFGPKMGKFDPKNHFFKNLRKPFLLGTEGSKYSNFQGSNPKNVIRSPQTDAFLAQKGQKWLFLAQKGQKLTQKWTLKKLFWTLRRTSECFSAVVSKRAFSPYFPIFHFFCRFSCHNCFDSDLKAIQKYILSQSFFDPSNFQLWSFLSKTGFSTIFTFQPFSCLNISNFLHHIICL